MVKQQSYIRPYNINGLSGRMLYLPSKNPMHLEKDIVLFYGMHSSIERMYPIASFLANYGNVIMPDLPGIGGMESFYKVNLEPSLDNYADFAYTFILSQKFKGKISVIGMSFGFMVLTRMLQRHQILHNKIKHVISFVGFGSHNDFKFSPAKKRLYRTGAKVLKSSVASLLAKVFLFNKYSIKLVIKVFAIANPKYSLNKGTDLEKDAISMEQKLWVINDPRTRFAIYYLFFTFDLTKNEGKIPLNLINIITPNDQYLDTNKVKLTLKSLYQKVETVVADLKVHAPSVVSSEEEAKRFFPKKVRDALIR